MERYRLRRDKDARLWKGGKGPLVCEADQGSVRETLRAQATAWPSRLPPRRLSPGRRRPPDRPTTLPRRGRSTRTLRPGCAGPTLSPVRRGLHGPCCVLPTVGHGPRQPLRGRRSPPLHAVPRPQASRRRKLRHEPCCGRARRSAAWLVIQRAPDPRGFAARPILRATGIGHANAGPTRYEDL